MLANAQSFEVVNGDTINRMDENNFKQGMWKYFDDDMLTKEGSFMNNKKHGLWRFYYENGGLNTEITYKNGMAKGYAKSYYRNGKVMEEGFWDVSHWKDNYIYYYNTGKPAYVWTYNDEGRRTGKQQYFHPNGNISIEGEWNDGKKEGTLREFNENGDALVEKLFKDGKLTAMASLMKNDAKQTGINQKSVSPEEELLQIFNGTGHFRLMKNGKIEREGQFVDGKLKDGKRYYYDENGECVKTEIYKNGRIEQTID